MASNRIGRINEEIQRELSSLIRTLKDPRVQSGMVTITHVDTTSDLRYSRIYVSVLEKSLEKDVIRGLKSAAGYLRRELGANMSLRYTPELQFIADEADSVLVDMLCKEEYLAQMNGIIAEIFGHTMVLETRYEQKEEKSMEQQLFDLFGKDKVVIK